MIRSLALIFILVIAIQLISAQSFLEQKVRGGEGLDYTRIHVVDKFVGKDFTNLFVRGNVPIIDGAFAIEALSQYIITRAKEEAGFTLSPNFYLTDVSLMNAVDEPASERDFWADPQHANLGEYVVWPMGLAGLYDPRSYDVPTQYTMSNGTVWEFDLLPERTHKLIEMLRQPGPIDPKTNLPRTRVIYIHCQAGRDRTGQAVIAYRLAMVPISSFTPSTLQTMFEKNIIEGGRCPNDWSVKATEWFCIYFKYNFGVNMGDCLHIADCKRFGGCTWPPAPY